MRSFLNTTILIVTLAMSVPGHGADEIRFDVAVLPEFQKYAALLGYPGYAAVALENKGLSPRPTIKMTVKEGGRALEAGSAVMRFEGRKGELYSYDFGVAVGVAIFETRITFPVVLDVSSLGSGKVSVVMKPPLAALLPADFSDRLHLRVGTIAGASAQATMLAYLDETAHGVSDAPQLANMIQSILLDAYNRSGGPATANRDDELALPTADQWMLIITFVIWLLLVSALLAVYVRRQRRGKPV